MEPAKLDLACYYFYLQVLMTIYLNCNLIIVLKTSLHEPIGENVIKWLKFSIKCQYQSLTSWLWRYFWATLRARCPFRLSRRLCRNQGCGCCWKRMAGICCLSSLCWHYLCARITINTWAVIRWMHWAQTGFGFLQIDGHIDGLVLSGRLAVQRVRVGKVLELWLWLLAAQNTGLLGHFAQGSARHDVLRLLHAFWRVDLPRGHWVEVRFGRVTPPHALESVIRDWTPFSLSW